MSTEHFLISNNILRTIALECSRNGTKALCNYCKHQGTSECKKCVWKVNDRFCIDHQAAYRRSIQYINEHPELFEVDTEYSQPMSIEIKNAYHEGYLQAIKDVTDQLCSLKKDNKNV